LNDVLPGVLDRKADGGNFGIKLKPGAEASHQPPRRLGVHLQPELQKQINKMLVRGYIRHNTSDFGAPVLFVKKKSGDWRMCVDYRDLNDKTVKDSHKFESVDDKYALRLSQFFARLSNLWLSLTVLSFKSR